jgi:acetyltransferase-like isoleucine patch superfamily enzyme
MVAAAGAKKKTKAGAVRAVADANKDCRMLNFLKNKSAFWAKPSWNTLLTDLKWCYYKLFRNRNIRAGRCTTIRGVKNIDTRNGRLSVACDYMGFIHKNDRTFLNIQGKFKLNGRFSIVSGCRVDIGPNAVVEVGDNSYINPFTRLIIAHGLRMGDNVAVSWDCQFLDEDFHRLDYDGKKAETDSAGIVIGNKVWIGNNVSIYKGVTIPNGCVIAANSVVKSSFDEKNVLLAGNPAKIVKRNISWW